MTNKNRTCLNVPKKSYAAKMLGSFHGTRQTNVGKLYLLCVISLTICDWRCFHEWKCFLLLKH